ncbi:aldehyde dehydrogenase family protein [Pseudarthrobacter oxydans]|uniref:aldehyde dehydrogenase family protein n=1 Tax=Pseudarthrobacter oxydans TaxID=1671 RepID=UPI003810F7A6
MSKTLFIDGEWTASSTGGSFDVLNPADGEIIGSAAEASTKDIDEAVAAARGALSAKEWRDITPAQRARILWRVADLIEANADELARLETLDQGQPLGVSRNLNIPGAAEHFRYFAGWCTKIEGATSPVSIPGAFHYTRREPVGVCALIIPWNFPFMTAAWKIAPALACGNTVIVKPAEQTPLTTVRLVEILTEAGIPAGVVNLVTGGPEAGRALTEHAGIDKVSFTGSTEVGKEIVRASSGNLKRVTLELGGKSPSIIARDADIDAAVQGNLMGNVFNSGQVCAAYSRFYVDSARVDEFAEKMATAAASLKMGPGLNPDTVLGPLNSAEHLARVESHVKRAVEAGAELRGGGSRAQGELANGYFFEPTIFTGVTDSMAVAREEIFGPVMPILSYDDADELVARANDSDFGLAAAIWTKDLNTAHEMAARIQAGTIYVNMLPAPDPAAPWGGYKSSGWGREMGPQAIEEYTELKGVWIGGLNL